MLWRPYSPITSPFGGPCLPSRDEGVRPVRDQPLPFCRLSWGPVAGSGGGERLSLCQAPLLSAPPSPLFLRATGLAPPPTLIWGAAQMFPLTQTATLSPRRAEPCRQAPGSFPPPLPPPWLPFPRSLSYLDPRALEPNRNGAPLKSKPHGVGHWRGFSAKR